MIYQQVLQQIKRFISPPFCAHCLCWLEQRDVLCADCIKKIRPIVSKKIAVTPSTNMPVFAISDYQDPLVRLITAKTWSDRSASYQLGELIWQLTDIKHVPFDYIVPIPLHWRRYALRGYNQAEEIARVLSKYSNKPIEPLLVRVRATKLQGRLGRVMRIENLKGAFELRTNMNIDKGARILLVDDVMTSGATVLAAAKELLKLKPLAITAVVACRVNK